MPRRLFLHGNGYNGDGRQALGARLYGPRSVAVDGSGTLYISDSYNYRIRKVDPTSGLIATVAGSGLEGFGGDGGPATRAQLNYPRGISLGSSGTLYIADANNRVIRAVGF